MVNYSNAKQTATTSKVLGIPSSSNSSQSSLNKADMIPGAKA